ncbi:MAG: UPF0280 family protein [Syntrophomonadaceae bacterium]|nr:UPF0280 family protein [Syntrophomonadaceae bacterium]
MDNNSGLNNVTRSYRSRHEAKDLYYFQVSLKETDLAIGVDRASYTSSLPAFCENEVRSLRGALESYIIMQPEFRTSFEPVTLLPGAPPLAVIMAQAAFKAGVGPMAAVAGAFAQAVGRQLRTRVRDVIVENGGDIYLDSSSDRLISVFAGQSKFSYKIALKVRAEESPLGICTSSGTVGPSISLGKADAVVIKGPDAALADAVATGAANRIQTEEDLIRAVEYVQTIKGITGILAVKYDRMAAWGDIEIVPT